MKKTILVLFALTLLVALLVPTSCRFCWPPTGNPSIEVIKYVSVDHGITWIDANDVASAPYLRVTQPVKYQFVVTNTGDVELTNITLTDSNLNIMDWENTIPSTLPPGGSFTCTVGFGHPPRAILDAQINTATATGDYNLVTYSDTDVAWYIGLAYGVPFP